MGSLYLLIYFKIEIKNLLHVNVNRFLIKNCIFPLHSVPSCRNPRLYPTPRTCRQEIFENLDVLTMSRDELEPGGSLAPASRGPSGHPRAPCCSLTRWPSGSSLLSVRLPSAPEGGLSSEPPRWPHCPVQVLPRVGGDPVFTVRGREME